jgi:hypothetical protein
MSELSAPVQVIREPASVFPATGLTAGFASDREATTQPLEPLDISPPAAQCLRTRCWRYEETTPFMCSKKVRKALNRALRSLP